MTTLTPEQQRIVDTLLRDETFFPAMHLRQSWEFQGFTNGELIAIVMQEREKLPKTKRDSIIEAEQLLIKTFPLLITTFPHLL